MVIENIEFRHATSDDLSFTYSIKKRSTEDLINRIWGWDDDFQVDYHRKNFTPDKTKIIIFDGLEIGFFVVEEHLHKIVLQTILIDPDFQGKGVGTKVLTDILLGAKDKTVELQVFKVNQKAKRFYDRLGFKVYGETDLHYKMKK